MFYLFDPEICGHDLVLQILKQQVLGIGTEITNFYTSIISHTIALYWSYNHMKDSAATVIKLQNFQFHLKGYIVI